MSDQEENINSQTTLQFGGVDFDVDVCEEDGVLVVNVENCETLDHWTGKYDTSYIEELTHKTGNFKQFHIFCNMLESAVLENCQSVSLDLLTYEDLKILREKKLGGPTRRKQKHNIEEKLKSKRYLIMTYTVEFDQIHYPLPLMYTGTSDTGTLKEQIKKLRKENHTLRSNTRNGSMLDMDYEKTVQENTELKEELSHCHQQMQDISSGNLSKELKVLKKVIQNLETDLVKERSKHQRLMMKKKKEYDEIVQELEDLKASERNYRVRCKNLTDELAIMKRNSRFSPAVNSRKKTTPNSHNTRSASRERLYTSSNDRGRARNSSATRRGRPLTSRSVSRDRSLSAGSSIGMRTPSPGGYRRFDPSAYVKEKERKRKEAEITRSRRRTQSSGKKRTVITPLSNHNHRKPPPHGASRPNRSKRSASKENYPYNGSDTDSSLTRLKGRNHRPNSTSKKKSNRRTTRYSDSEDEHFVRPKSKTSSTKKTTYSGPSDADGEDHAIGIAEIDARLEALQNFMRNTMD